MPRSPTTPRARGRCGSHGPGAARLARRCAVRGAAPAFLLLAARRRLARRRTGRRRARPRLPRARAHRPRRHVRGAGVRPRAEGDWPAHDHGAGAHRRRDQHRPRDRRRVSGRPRGENTHHAAGGDATGLRQPLPPLQPRFRPRADGCEGERAAPSRPVGGDRGAGASRGGADCPHRLSRGAHPATDPQRARRRGRTDAAPARRLVRTAERLRGATGQLRPR